MTEAHSDPDLALDFSDIPETGTVGTDPSAAMRALIRAVQGLGRWAQREHRARRTQQATLRGVILAVIGGSGAVVVAIAGAIWTVSADRAETRASLDAMRDDVAELREAYERVEARQWDGGGPTHTSGGRSAGGE